jgi:hypothetical protein
MQEFRMRKAALLTVAAILVASGVAVAMKRSEAPAEAPALHTALVVTGQPTTSAPAMMKIVPAPVIDPNAEVFVGTGDGSGGAWVRP